MRGMGERNPTPPPARKSPRNARLVLVPPRSIIPPTPDQHAVGTGRVRRGPDRSSQVVHGNVSPRQACADGGGAAAE
eukprot:5954253-Pyramimonas_sp.AAC.1